MTLRSVLRSTYIPGLAMIFMMIAAGTWTEIRAVSDQIPSHKVIAYYFHTNTRCSTCKKIEEYSKEAILEGFKTELENGTLELRIVNYEEPQNRHFVKDYKLVTKSLILVNMIDGEEFEWTNLKLVWQLTKNKEAFLNYVRKEVRNSLSQNY